MQQHLWQDGYTILTLDTGIIGQTRLRRFLNWLDKHGYDWVEPHLMDYEEYLRDECQLHRSTIYQNITELREHYLSIISNTDLYAHIPSEERAVVVNTILEQLGFNIASVNFEYLINGETNFVSDNMKILLPPNAHQNRDTQIVAFIHWLDNTKREWHHPDLIEYKAYLLEHSSAENIGNALNAIRRRYYEMAEDPEIMDLLSADEQVAFHNELRKRLGYLDQFPSRSEPVREMLEDDPFNQQYLTAKQTEELLNKPDQQEFVGVRDRALIALALATGIQQFEIARVEINHLQQEYKGKKALYVVPGKLRNERIIPYDDYEWVLDWIYQWLDLAQITDGCVFRGTYGNRDALRPHGIAPETASDILTRYPVNLNGSDVPLLFGDLRATCARRWYDAEISLNEIERRLGINYRRSTLKLLGLRVRAVYGGI